MEGGGCYLPWLWLLIDATDSKETRSTVLYLQREGGGGGEGERERGVGREYEDSRHIASRGVLG